MMKESASVQPRTFYSDGLKKPVDCRDHIHLRAGETGVMSTVWLYSQNVRDSSLSALASLWAFRLQGMLVGNSRCVTTVVTSLYFYYLYELTN
jgi:hypothetical protein